MQGIAWLDDGRIVFCAAGDDGIQILSIPEGGGPATVVATIGENMTDAHAHSISAIPAGRFVAVVHSFFGNTFKVLTEGDGGLRTLFELDDTNVLTAHWVPGGHLLFSRGEGEIADELWAVPLSLDPLEVTGEPFFVQADATGESISLDGTLAFTEKDKGQEHQLAWWSADGGTEPFGRKHERAISAAYQVAGGSSIFYVVGRTMPLKLWNHDLRRGVSTEVSTGAMATMWAGTHPDGRIVYASVEIRDEGPVLNSYLLPASGRGEPELWFEGGVTGLSDTHALVGQLREDQIDYYAHDLATGERSLLRAGEEMSTTGSISRDGAWLVYSNDGKILLTRFPSGEGEWQVSTEDGAGDASFSPDGSEIRFTHEQGLYRVGLQTEPEVVLGLPELIGEAPEDTDLSIIADEDSDRFLAVQSVGSDEGHLVVVLNWAAQLDER